MINLDMFIGYQQPFKLPNHFFPFFFPHLLHCNYHNVPVSMIIFWMESTRTDFVSYHAIELWHLVSLKRVSSSFKYFEYVSVPLYRSSSDQTFYFVFYSKEKRKIAIYCYCDLKVILPQCILWNDWTLSYWKLKYDLMLPLCFVGSVTFLLVTILSSEFLLNLSHSKVSEHAPLVLDTVLFHYVISSEVLKYLVAHYFLLFAIEYDMYNLK